MSAGSKAADRVGDEAAVTVEIPGEICAPALGVRLWVELAAEAGGSESGSEGKLATLRNWKPGDRVRLRYSGGPKKVKEVLERMKITGSARALWPVLEMGGQIVGMRGVPVEPEPGLMVSVRELPEAE
jgi:tRNA(Ile)-lysidine synthase